LFFPLFSLSYCAPFSLCFFLLVPFFLFLLSSCFSPFYLILPLFSLFFPFFSFSSYAPFLLVPFSCSYFFLVALRFFLISCSPHHLVPCFFLILLLSLPFIYFRPPSHPCSLFLPVLPLLFSFPSPLCSPVLSLN
jgi:hypothetical protein